MGLGQLCLRHYLFSFCRRPNVSISVGWSLKKATFEGRDGCEQLNVFVLVNAFPLFFGCWDFFEKSLGLTPTLKGSSKRRAICRNGGARQLTKAAAISLVDDKIFATSFDTRKI